MTTEIVERDVQTQQTGMVRNPFAKGVNEHLAHGSVAIESERATAETQAKLLVALKFPRDLERCFEKARAAASRIEFAREAFYGYNRGGGLVRGPSIRMAEELARCWGNFEYGLRELSNAPGVSEMEAFAWDYEANVVTSQRFTVKHVRDTKEAKKELKDERDIYEATANMGARRMRSRILANLPAEYVDGIVAVAERTLRDEGQKFPLEERIKQTVTAFAPHKITQAMIEKRLNHPVAKCTHAEIDDLKSIYMSIKDGESQASQWFAMPEVKPPQADAPKTDAAPDEKAKRGKKEKEPEGARETVKDPVKPPEEKPTPPPAVVPPPAPETTRQAAPSPTAPAEDLF